MASPNRKGADSGSLLRSEVRTTGRVVHHSVRPTPLFSYATTAP
ncbi:hypothetical protein [Brachybacterium sacelli]